jgi:MFS family permease
MITLGQVIAYGIGAGFFHIHGGWRWMVGLGSVPAGLQILFLFFLPESREQINPCFIFEHQTDSSHTSAHSPEKGRYISSTSDYVENICLR